MPKVVNLGRVKDLLYEWERVRQHILAGRLTGFCAAVRDSSTAEVIYIGGVYRESPGMVAKAALRMSAAQMLAEDELPPRTRSRKV